MRQKFLCFPNPLPRCQTETCTADAIGFSSSSFSSSFSSSSSCSFSSLASQSSLPPGRRWEELYRENLKRYPCQLAANLPSLSMSVFHPSFHPSVLLHLSMHVLHVTHLTFLISCSFFQPENL